jgi:hypothetical protein
MALAHVEEVRLIRPDTRWAAGGHLPLGIGPTPEPGSVDLSAAHSDLILCRRGQNVEQRGYRWLGAPALDIDQSPPELRKLLGDRPTERPQRAAGW